MEQVTERGTKQLALAGLWSGLLVLVAGAAFAAGLNDTGQTTCYNDTGAVSPEPSTHPRQDCTTWGHVLAASYILYFLPPCYRNYGKRPIKTPKLYLLDAALAAWLTRQPSAAAMLAGGMGGALFEGWVVGEAVKVFTLLGRLPDLFFWRSHDGLEVDLIVLVNGRLLPVEIKLTATPTLRHLEPLDKFRALAGDEAAESGVLVCRVEQPQPLPQGNLALPWQRFPAWLRERLTARTE